jgi:FkbM family methyltransferase
MREALWLWLRSSGLLRKLYGLPLARKPMSSLSYLLVPSRRKRRLRVRSGPGKGLVFELNPRWETPLWEGDYELAAQQILVERLVPGAVFYDVGAGFGFYSSLAARLGAQVFAFEPDEENAECVLRHAQWNALGAKIEVVRLAVLASSGVTRFERAPQERGHGNGQVPEAGDSGGTNATVRCTSLDDFARLNPPPSLIKIDVEGSESDVLKGAQQLFAQWRPGVLCEVHDAKNKLFVSDWFEKQRYSIEHLGNRQEYPCHLIATPR